MALRRTAERVDAQMRGYMAEQGIRETWATSERLLVCVGPGPTGAAWCGPDAGSRRRLDAPWTVVHVETPGSPGVTGELSETLGLARATGRGGGRPSRASTRSRKSWPTPEATTSPDWWSAPPGPRQWWRRFRRQHGGPTDSPERRHRGAGRHRRGCDPQDSLPAGPVERRWSSPASISRPCLSPR